MPGNVIAVRPGQVVDDSAESSSEEEAAYFG
jgi:hypothetical protein